MASPKFNICADSQMEHYGSHVYGSYPNVVDLENYDSVNLMEVTDAPCHVRLLGTITTLSTGASNAQTMSLGTSIEDFDYFVIMVNSGSTSITNTFTTVMLPSLMWTVFNSSTAADRIILKGASTYYVNCYFSSKTQIVFQAAGTSTSVKVYGVNM